VLAARWSLIAKPFDEGHDGNGMLLWYIELLNDHLEVESRWQLRHFA